VGLYLPRPLLTHFVSNAFVRGADSAT